MNLKPFAEAVRISCAIYKAMKPYSCLLTFQEIVEGYPPAFKNLKVNVIN